MTTRTATIAVRIAAATLAGAIALGAASFALINYLGNLIAKGNEP